MRKLILYSAISIDGKIARENGDVSWLEDVPNPEKTDYGYNQFYGDIDCLLMGGKTYRQILDFPIPYPYEDKRSYVFSRDKTLTNVEYAEIIHEDPATFVTKLKRAKGKDIWLVGGGELNGYLYQHELIDEFILFLMPIALGNGISLFGSGIFDNNLTLKNITQYGGGVVRMDYTS